MQKLTALWLDTIAQELEHSIDDLQYNQTRLQDVPPPCLGYKRMHHNKTKAKQGCPADILTPQVLFKWTGRPGAAALHPFDLSFVHAVWHEQCFRIAKAAELCDATEEEYENLACRNAKDALRLGNGNLPGDSDEDSENIDEDDNGDGEPVSRVHVLNIHERVLRQYTHAACRWLQLNPQESLEVRVCGWCVSDSEHAGESLPMSSPTVANFDDLQEDTRPCEQRDSNLLDEPDAGFPTESYAAFSEVTDPSLGLSVVDPAADRHQPYVSAAEFWQGAEAPPTGGGHSVASNVPTRQPYDMPPPSQQVHQQFVGPQYPRYPQVEAPVNAAQDILNSRDPAVMQLVQALRSQLQQGTQEPPPPMPPQTPQAYVAAMPTDYVNAHVPRCMQAAQPSASAPLPASSRGHLQAGPSGSEPFNLPQGAVQPTTAACNYQQMEAHHLQPQVWLASRCMVTICYLIAVVVSYQVLVHLRQRIPTLTMVLQQVDPMVLDTAASPGKNTAAPPRLNAARRRLAAPVKRRLEQPLVRRSGNQGHRCSYCI